MPQGYNISPTQKQSHTRKLKIKEEVPRSNMRVSTAKKRPQTSSDRDKSKGKIILPPGMTYHYDEDAIKYFYMNPGASEVRL